MRLDGVQRHELGGLLDAVGGAVDAGLLALDLARTSLPSHSICDSFTSASVRVSSRVRIAVAAAASCGSRVSTLLVYSGPAAARSVERGQVAGAGLAQLLIDRQAIALDDADLGVAGRAPSDRVLERAGRGDTPRSCRHRSGSQRR